MSKEKISPKVLVKKIKVNKAGLKDDPNVVGKPTATESIYGSFKWKPVKKRKDSPVREYKNIVIDSNDPGYINRVMIATPTKGMVRMEWVMARYGQIVPVNWSQVQYVQFLYTASPIRFNVANAQNVIVKQVIEKDFEWLLLIEDDVILPETAFLTLNKYIREETAPVVSGLYFTKSDPPEPLVFRGRGNSYYGNWKIGDLVWADAVPTGCLLIHAGILREMWKESPEYSVNGIITRRVFDDPRKLWYDPATGSYNTITGTSDLDWCTRVKEGGFFAKAGWKEFQKKKYPFLVDTSISCKHIDLSTGKQYPS